MRKKKSALQKRKDDPKSKYWKTKADDLWKAIIHESSRCAVGEGCAGNLEAHHLISRSSTYSRHRVENGILLCSTHHKFSHELSAHKAPLAFAEWLQKHYPDKWEWCSENKHKIAKPDYREAYDDLVGWAIENAPDLLDD